LTTDQRHYTAQSLIMGMPRAGQQQAIAAILARPHGYSEGEIKGIFVPTYWIYARRSGIDPVLALAQAIHETENFSSPWAQRPYRNPAGIGVTGVPGEGVQFASWANDSIPAHVGRLLAYTLLDSRASADQRALIARALSYRPLDDALRGSALTIAQLGAVHNPTGRGWAKPGGDYGDLIAGVAERIRLTQVI
jgi:hypothetical protein